MKLEVEAIEMFTLIHLFALSACVEPVDDPSPGRLVDGILLPNPEAATWVDTIDNPYLPFPIGATWHYEAALADGSAETVDIEVLAEPREVNGVQATVVYDVVLVDGEKVEETWDWYAQDTEGNVWYLGEDTCEWEAGACVQHAGAWEWGVDGALPGWSMPGNPTVDGQPYFQEYYKGEAEDVGEVIGLGEHISVPAGDFTDCIRTADTSHLDATLNEEKVYCAGVGNVYVLEPDTEENLVTHSGLTIPE